MAVVTEAAEAKKSSEERSVQNETPGSNEGTHPNGPGSEDNFEGLDATEIKDRAEKNMKLLFLKLQEHAASQGKVSYDITLPEPIMPLPRQRPIPRQVKEQTKWEKYAHNKGIRSRKRERMIWDEETQSWNPRWGYKRGKDDQRDWIVEVKDKDDPFVDKFQQKRNNKKLRVLKNRQKQLRNLERITRTGNFKKNKNGNGAVLDMPSGVANDLTVKGSKKGKKRTKEVLSIAQASTASLGRFDEYQKGEPKRTLKSSKKQKFEPAEKLSTKDRDMKILQRVLKP